MVGSPALPHARRGGHRRLVGPGLPRDLLQTMLRILDPGTFSGDAGWGLRLVTFIVTIFGITVAAVLIGLIATGIESKVEDLRRGRSPVVEAVTST